MMACSACPPRAKTATTSQTLPWDRQPINHQVGLRGYKAYSTASTGSSSVPKPNWNRSEDLDDGDGEGQRGRGAEGSEGPAQVFGTSWWRGPETGELLPNATLGTFGEGHGGAKTDIQLRARDTQPSQPNFSGNRDPSDQSAGPVALSHDAAQRDLAGWHWALLGCHSRIEELIRARHHNRTPAI